MADWYSGNIPALQKVQSYPSQSQKRRHNYYYILKLIVAQETHVRVRKDGDFFCLYMRFYILKFLKKIKEF